MVQRLVLPCRSYQQFWLWLSRMSKRRPFIFSSSNAFRAYAAPCLATDYAFTVKRADDVVWYTWLAGSRSHLK